MNRQKFVSLVSLITVLLAPAVRTTFASPAEVTGNRSEPLVVHDPVHFATVRDLSSVTTSQPPTVFVPNHGQWPAAVRYQMRGLGGTWWFTDDSIWLTVVRGTQGTQGTEATQNSELRTQDSELRTQGVNLHLTLPGLSPTARWVAVDEQPAKMNYLLGNDATKWQANVPAFGSLRWEGVLPGVDLVVSDRWIATNHYPLHLRVDGADSLRLDYTGQVVADTATGPVPLPLSATIVNRDTISLGCFSSANLQSPISNLQSPVDDPGDMQYSTFLGGSQSDSGHEIVVTADGSAIVTGSTFSTNFPTTPGVFDSSYNGQTDIFVTKLTPNGQALAYSTYLGGSDDDNPFGIALDSQERVFLTGQTESVDFPLAGIPFDPSFNGGTNDVFVTNLSADGTALRYSTFLGGGGTELGVGIFVDIAGAIFVGGRTDSSNFPTTPGAYDTSFNGGQDGFVTKFAPFGNLLVYSTFIGGSGSDMGDAFAVGPAGSAYLAGWGSSSDFPTTPGAYDRSPNGGHDIFLAKFTADGQALVYSTLLGGDRNDYASYHDNLAVDTSGAAYLTGDTESGNFPTTPGAFDTTFNGGRSDGYVTKVNPAGSALEYSTLLGGSDNDCNNGCSVSVDAEGNAHIVGRTLSSNFPITAGAFDTSYNGSEDTFVAKLSSTGTSLVYSTYLGGSGAERSPYGTDGTLDASGMVYITGQTSSAGYPVTPGAFDTSYNGGSDAVVSKLSPDIGGVMHIADITMGYIFFGNRYRLGAVTTVVDARGIPVPGALVTGIVYFPDGQQVVSGGLTNFRGQAFAKNVVELLGTYTFTVIDITKPGSTYDPSQNVETSDSITIP